MKCFAQHGYTLEDLLHDPIQPLREMVTLVDRCDATLDWYLDVGEKAHFLFTKTRDEAGGNHSYSVSFQLGDEQFPPVAALKGTLQEALDAVEDSWRESRRLFPMVSVLKDGRPFGCGREMVWSVEDEYICAETPLDREGFGQVGRSYARDTGKCLSNPSISLSPESLARMQAYIEKHPQGSST